MHSTTGYAVCAGHCLQNDLTGKDSGKIQQQWIPGLWTAEMTWPCAKVLWLLQGTKNNSQNFPVFPEFTSAQQSQRSPEQRLAGMAEIQQVTSEGGLADWESQGMLRHCGSLEPQLPKAWAVQWQLADTAAKISLEKVAAFSSELLCFKISAWTPCGYGKWKVKH